MSQPSRTAFRVAFLLALALSLSTPAAAQEPDGRGRPDSTEGTARPDTTAPSPPPGAAHMFHFESRPSDGESAAGTTRVDTAARSSRESAPEVHRAPEAARSMFRFEHPDPKSTAGSTAADKEAAATESAPATHEASAPPPKAAPDSAGSRFRFEVRDLEPAYQESLPDVDAEVKFDTPPKYDTLALYRRLSAPVATGDASAGRVLIRILINSRGQVVGRKLVYSSNPSLEEPAMKAVTGFTCTPARRDGHPVAVWITIPLDFSHAGGH